MEENTGLGAAGRKTSGSWSKRVSDHAGEAEISELGNRLCDHYGKLLGELRKSVASMREADSAMRKALAAYYDGVFRVYREMRMSHVHRHGCFSCLRLKLNTELLIHLHLHILNDIKNICSTGTAFIHNKTAVLFRHLCSSHCVSPQTTILNELSSKLSLRSFKGRACTWIFKWLF